MKDITFSAIKFTKDKDAFMHNLGADYACFALWKSARSYRDKIRVLLERKFNILLETEVEWSDTYFHANAERLYESPMFLEVENEKIQSRHAQKIGDNRFVLFVVKDPNPCYTYAQSVSKKIEWSNLNVVETKYTIREWIYKDKGIKYGVHSTNNIYEFCYQCTLLLGIQRFSQLINGQKLDLPYLRKDLEGAGGWKNWDEVFEILKYTGNYLVLRGFEALPEENPGKDMDVLTDNYQLFASALGIKQREKFPYKGVMVVDKEDVKVDIRFVGDNYYDASWAKEMLETKVQERGFFRPREDHYFFSLLFHAKVQKPAVKEIYVEILDKIAADLHFDWFRKDFLGNNQKIGELLAGFFRTKGFYYDDPLDYRVFKNKEVVKCLPRKKDKFEVKKWNEKALRRYVKRHLPDRVVEKLISVLNLK